MPIDQKKMRGHLVTCLEKPERVHSISDAVHTRKKMRRARDRNILIHSYCVCRMPEYFDYHMIACDEWYHYKCVGIDSSSHPDCKINI